MCVVICSVVYTCSPFSLMRVSVLGVVHHHGRHAESLQPVVCRLGSGESSVWGPFPGHGGAGGSLSVHGR